MIYYCVSPECKLYIVKELLLEYFGDLGYFFKTLCFGCDLVYILHQHMTEDWAAASYMTQTKRREKYLRLCSDDLLTMYCL